MLSSSLGTTMEMWRPQLTDLHRHFRIVRYDHRGHGRSAVPPAPYRIDDLGHDVIDLLDHLDLERVHFAGLSIGGMTGMWLAAHAPGRIHRLALLCTSAKLGTEEYWAQRAATVTQSGCSAVADAVVERWFTPAFRRHSPDVVAHYTTMLAGIPAAGYAACCSAIGAMDLRTDLPRISAATMVIAGADDPATPLEHARVIATAIPDARLKVIDDAAHLASVEQPDIAAALVAQHFLGEP
ncbi:3-oxoadipate enol-lactonase [Phytoactinopolyspora limicola]|uniref:3-oxoadipate enol-lactonase n=1 Tax=Phytoactinopolyspora limicola TaxID=2715536 RepID=UPI001FE43EFA